MSSLTCDLCSGAPEMGVGGLATCNDCGMKYTRDRMQEMIQEMKGAGVGSSPAASGPSIENLRELAAHALESNNLDEAEAYASRIIEADPSDYQAWITKGQAAGWQSSLKNMRILEAANCLAKAVELAPETFRDHVEEHVSGQITSIASAIIKTRASIYIEYPEPGGDELPAFTQQLSTLRSAYEATSRLKRAERKDLQGQIEAVEGRRAHITQAQQAARAAVADELAQAEARLKAVQDELTKPR